MTRDQWKGEEREGLRRGEDRRREGGDETSGVASRFSLSW